MELPFSRKVLRVSCLARCVLLRLRERESNSDHPHQWKQSMSRVGETVSQICESLSKRLSTNLIEDKTLSSKVDGKHHKGIFGNSWRPSWFDRNRQLPVNTYFELDSFLYIKSKKGYQFLKLLRYNHIKMENFRYFI